jgi:hypothetical protein
MNEREDLKALVDGELDPIRAAEVRSAAEADPGLGRELADLHAISQVLRTETIQAEPVGLEETLVALRRGPARKRMPFFVRMALPVAGVATVLLGVAVLLPQLVPSQDVALRSASLGAPASAPAAESAAVAADLDDAASPAVWEVRVARVDQAESQLRSYVALMPGASIESVVAGDVREVVLTVPADQQERMVEVVRELGDATPEAAAASPARVRPAPAPEVDQFERASERSSTGEPRVVRVRLVPHPDR